MICMVKSFWGYVFKYTRELLIPFSLTSFLKSITLGAVCGFAFLGFLEITKLSEKFAMFLIKSIGYIAIIDLVFIVGLIFYLAYKSYRDCFDKISY